MPTTLMRRGIALLPWLGVFGTLCCLPIWHGTRASSGPPIPSDKSATLHVPEGFTVELVAGPPLVEHPMMACFDERGRLFVADSAGKNLKAEDLLKDPPSCIRVLESTRRDGRFDKSSVFADKLTFPMGVLCYDAAVYTASPPSIWKLEDTKGTGVADRRTELVTHFGFTGNAADIHGPFLGPDGRFYWTDGRHGHEIKKPDGSVLKGKAARIFRCKPDGSDVEVVCGGGMDDPVEIAFSPEGEAFATVDIFLGRPIRVDAIIHCVEGGVFPYHEVYQEFKSTGGLLPAAIELGWVAPAGLMRYRDGGLGEPYRDNLLSAQFNRHRIQRHALKREGATYSGTCEDFLVSSDPDFHPTDVLQDADGSLLVIDTGGWFRIGCPESKLAKPEVKGGIYRVRRRGAEALKDPRGLDLAWERMTPKMLAGLLDDQRFAVRDRSVEALGKMGAAAVPSLKPTLAERGSRLAQRNAIWALARIESSDARAFLREALGETDQSIRHAATHVVGLNRDRLALKDLMWILRNDIGPEVKREAATALGRIRRPEAVPALLEALGTTHDRFLEHAIIFALIEIDSPAETRAGLGNSNPFICKGALIALDQMEGGGLTRREVAALLDSDDSDLQRATLAVLSAHGWAEEAMYVLTEWLSRKQLTEGQKQIVRSALLAFSREPPIHELVEVALTLPEIPTANRLLVLETMALVTLEKLPARWIAGLGKCLQSKEGEVLRQAIATIRALRITAHDEALLQIARNGEAAPDLRVAALAVVGPRLPQIEPALVDFLLARLSSDVAPLDRLAAARALGSIRLTDAQLVSCLPSAGRAGPLELPSLLGAFERTPSMDVAKGLAAALAKSPGLESLSPELLRRAFAAAPDHGRDLLTPLLKRLAVDEEQQKKRLAGLSSTFTGGDVARGREVFYGKKASCFACHAVKSEGGRIGPDLSTIGAIRSGHDLLESIIFPNASFARGYEPYQIVTRQGQSYSGIIARETADTIYLFTADRAEVAVARSTIESFEPGRVSIMPQGLEQQLTRPELADLLAFLMSLR